MRPCPPRSSVVLPRVQLRPYDRHARRGQRVGHDKVKGRPRAMVRVEPALRYYTFV